MTQKEKLIELFSDFCNDCMNGNKDNVRITDLADFLMEHGCVVFDEDVIDRRNLPLISMVADRPINEVLKLMEAEKNGDIIRLPFKPEETVYVAVHDRVDKTKIGRIVIDSFGMSIITNIGCCFPVQMVYKTHEEAEDALEKEREKQRRWQTVQKLVKRALEKEEENE